MKKSLLNAVIFDFDGTLVESVGIKDKVFEKIFARFGQAGELALRFSLEHSGLSRVKKFSYLLEQLPAAKKSSVSLENLCQEFADNVVASVISCPMAEGALQVLTRWQGKTHLLLASITPPAELDHIVRERQLEGFFDGVYGSTETKDKLIDVILTNHGIQSGNAILIGDTREDQDAAKKSGIGFVGRINQKDFASDVIAFCHLNEIAQHIETQFDLEK